MMKRRLTLLIISFCVLLGVFGVYTAVSRIGIGKRDINVGIVPPGHLPQKPQTNVGVSLNEGKDIHLVARDKAGRLESIIDAPDWTKQDDGSYIITKPHVQQFQPDGQQIHITADKAVMFVEEAGNKMNFRRGTLDGNVNVIIDRSTDPNRTPYEQRMGDLVRIFIDSLNFDNDLLEMTSTSHVTIFSSEADFYGRDLTIRWNQAPRELRLLRIEQGEMMTVYNIPKEFQVVSLPVSEEVKPATTMPATGPATTMPQSPTAPAPAIAAATKPANATTKRPTAAPYEIVARTKSDKKHSAAASTRPVKPPIPEPPAQNVLKATFHESVQVPAA